MESLGGTLIEKFAVFVQTIWLKTRPYYCSSNACGKRLALAEGLETGKIPSERTKQTLKLRAHVNFAACGGIYKGQL